MKNTALVLIIMILCLNDIYSQNIQPDKNFAKYYKVDFAISDAPAFKILGKEPSNILRPSSSDLISFIASNIFNPSDITLPNSYAAEISPAQLIRYNKTTLSEFINNYLLYNIRISIGSSKDPKTNKYSLGLGLKSTIINNGDLRKDTPFINAILHELRNREDYKDEIQRKFLDSCKCLMTDDGVSEAYTIYQKKELDKNPSDSEFEKIKSRYKEEYWNKEKLEIAFAMLGYSKDSLAKNVSFSKYAVWSSFCFPVYSWGQILLGGNMNYNTTLKKGSGSIGARFYGGTNNVKGFFETQYKRDNELSVNNWAITIGSELNLTNGLWIEYSAGYESNKDDTISDSNFISQFNIKFAIL